MKANEFFKKVGIEAVRSYVAAYEDTLTDDLKRLVESYELVESYGGIESAKKELQHQSILRWINPETERLRAAIADVESCMEV